MPKEDPVLKRILAFNDAKGGGVVVRKAARGYSLFREDNGRPVARLRPTGKGDMVEVIWWSHRDKWDQIGDFGPFVMPLDEALDYVSRDPMGISWGRVPSKFHRGLCSAVSLPSSGHTRADWDEHNRADSAAGSWASNAGFRQRLHRLTVSCPGVYNLQLRRDAAASVSTSTTSSGDDP